MTVLIDGLPAYLDILDTAGQEEFRSMMEKWIEDGHGFLLVYSIVDPNSFEHIKVIYRKIIRVHEDGEKVPIVLVGNKSDLIEGEETVQTNEASNLANSWGCKFFETSARNRQNVNECFLELAHDVIVRRYNQPKELNERRKSFCLIL